MAGGGLGAGAVEGGAGVAGDGPGGGAVQAAFLLGHC